MAVAFMLFWAIAAAVAFMLFWIIAVAVALKWASTFTSRGDGEAIRLVLNEWMRSGFTSGESILPPQKADNTRARIVEGISARTSGLLFL